MFEVICGIEMRLTQNAKIMMKLSYKIIFSESMGLIQDHIGESLIKENLVVNI